MTGPAAHIARNVLDEVQSAIDDDSGWAWFKNQFMPTAVADTFRPDDDLLMKIAYLADSADGRRIFAWLHDLTDRAPYPMVCDSIEATALAAARHQGRAGVGHVLAKAVAEGQRLIQTRKDT